MASHVSDTWQAMCHNAWQRHACVTHGKPCVNMHGSFEVYIRGFTRGAASFSSWEQQGEGGGREKRKGGKEKRKGGEERKGEREEKKRKGKKKREEERGGREEKEREKRSSVE